LTCLRVGHTIVLATAVVRRREEKTVARQAGAVLGILFLAHAQSTQRGSKLVGTGAVGAASQGTSVAISTDRNPGIVGGYTDNSNAGAVWVYTRSEGSS
jgi:hypothetical protein